jgi:hypothetical protein
MTSALPVPFTTVPAGALDPKFPRLVGDSWRPVVAGLLGAAPLAVTVAITGATMTGASLLGAAAAATPRHAVVVPAQQGVTVAAGALTSPKYPDDGGD